MMNRVRTHRLLSSIAVLVLLSLSCSPCGWLSRPDSDWPNRPIEISQEAAQRLADKLEGSWDSQGNGDFLLQVTDQELTSYLNLRLLDSADIPLKEPRLWFTRGKVYASGQLSTDQLPFDASATIVSKITVVDGVLQLYIEQARYGRIPIPSGIVKSLETRVNGTMAHAQLGIEIIELEVLETEILVVAAPR